MYIPQENLENAPGNWYRDSTFANVFKESTTEALVGDSSKMTFPFAKVMKRIKEVQSKGYNYMVYSSLCG